MSPVRTLACVLPLAAVIGLSGCFDGEEATSPAPSPTPSPTATATPSAISSLGADGWAATGAGTTGGDGASAAKTYTVTNRNELIQALYGGTATIEEDGTFSGTLDESPKIIYVSGTISLNVNRALEEQSADDYIQGSCASETYGYDSEGALWEDYYAAFRPSVWGLDDEVSGTPEDARNCAAGQQGRVVRLIVPSNTSLLGMGEDARIVHGGLRIGNNQSDRSENIVIRNIGFEDAFDFFPQWDPTDSTGRWNSNYDLIWIEYADNVWIDHSSFTDGDRTDNEFPSVWDETVDGVDYSGSAFKVQHHDGLVDITRSGNLVTVSYNLFAEHDKTTLIGGTDTPNVERENPRALKVTFHHNVYRNVTQRMPRVRFGMVHIYNNFYFGSRQVSAYPFSQAWFAGQSSKIYAENNVFLIGGGSVENVASGSVSSTQTGRCLALNYSAEECATTFYDAGTILNDQPVDASAYVFTRSDAIGETTWQPSTFYQYDLDSTEGLIAQLVGEAGPGKL